MEHQNISTVRSFMRIAGSLSLILAPLGVAVGWALNYPSLAAFLHFDFASPYLASGQSDSTGQFLATLLEDGGFRFFLLPHYFVYAAIPLFIAASLFLADVLFRKAPWHALIGTTLTSVGAVYFIGVLGAWMSFPAILNIPADQVPNLLPVLAALTTVQGILLVSTMLSILLFLGMVILGFGLYKNRIIPRWSAVLVIVGNILIIAFAGTENWMVTGSLLMLVGLLPLTMKMLHSGQLKQ